MKHTLTEEVLNGRYDYSHLNSLWTKARSANNRKDRIFKVISAVDNGEQWSIYRKKIRKSQALPTSNILSTIRDNRQGALSINGFVGEFVSESQLMDPFAVSLNDYFSFMWRKNGFDTAVDEAIENMLTFGTGITMVHDAGSKLPSNPEDYMLVDGLMLKNIDPSSLYPDPGAKNEAEASYYFLKDTATIGYLRTIPMFKDYIDQNRDKLTTTMITNDSGVTKLNSDFSSSNWEDTESDFITYVGKKVLDDGTEQWDMAWLFGGHVIATIENIQPARCPFIFIREKRDRRSFWGQSTYKQNLALQLSINEIDSAIITHAKKQQDPIAFVKTTSGLNVADFAKNRDQAGRVFQYSVGTPQEAVSYATLPDLPRDITSMSSGLIERIKDMTGVGDIAQGQSSGSLQTAGGISQILQRSGLKDMKVIKNIQRYLRELYSIIIDHLKPLEGIVRYATKDHVEQEMAYKQLDLAMIDWDNIALLVDVVNHTGGVKEANKQIIEELFQQSVQYSSAQAITEPAIMTADEYLQGIKEPNLHNLIDQIQERRKRERELDMSQKVAEIIQMYLQLVQQGTNPQEALIMIAQEYSSDPGILKGFAVADLAKQQAQAQAGSAEGSNQHSNTQ